MQPPPSPPPYPPIPPFTPPYYPLTVAFPRLFPYPSAMGVGGQSAMGYLRHFIRGGGGTRG